ncbi:exocyst complex component 5-like [Lytechinus variegatus]|uniref:exocyst complex component 5-like n=1 Tax=Lytechinus variegatus TaxID=7654 RepID=UPI001BB1F604|nr:exocyst complex component 5-like [Lytechinus variegatus]
MGNPFAKPKVVTTSTPRPTTTKPTTKPTTPTTPTTIATTTTTTTTPEPTTTPMTTTPSPARITSEGLITHSSPIAQIESKSRACCTTPTFIMTSSVSSTIPLHATLPSAFGTPSSSSATSQSPYLLPLAIVMSTSFLIVAFILLVLVFRRRHHSDKHGESGTHPVLAQTQVFSNSSFNAESSVECSLNHIYVEHGERDSKLHDGLYTYVTKPSVMGGLPKGYAPSVPSPKRVFRGHPDGKCRSVQTKGLTSEDFGDEDHYNLLFEDRPAVVNVIVMNPYENHNPNDCYQNYANVTEIPESTIGFLEAPPTSAEDTISVKSCTSSMKNSDSSNKAVTADSQPDIRPGNVPPIHPDSPAVEYEPNGSIRVLTPNDTEVIAETKQESLYENTPRSRGDSVKSPRNGEPKYYVLERQLNQDPDDNETGMVENILYQSVTE